MKYNEKKMLYGIGIVFLFLATVSFTYAYFTATIVNKDVKDQVVQTGTLELTYTDGPEIIMNNIKPGTSINKTVYVANTGTLDTSYNLVWQQLINEITNDEMVIEGTCTRMNGITEEVDGTCDGVESAPIKKLRIKENISIEPNIIHKYDLTITFKEINGDQNYNQNKKISGVIGINEYKSDGSIYCTYNGEMVQGAEYVSGDYTYRYMQQGKFVRDGKSLDWEDIDIDGWGIQLTDKTSTEPTVAETCTYINGKPIVSAAEMYAMSKAVSIDMSKMNTSNIVNFASAFSSATAETIDLTNVDTSSAKTFIGMFENTKAKTLDVSSFNTSNVTDMSYMFIYTSATNIIGLENFNTSNVETLLRMFASTNVSSLNLKNFDTSKVKNMSGLFAYSKVQSLDLSNFDTSKVMNMAGMFASSKATKIIGLDKFDTSNVTTMYTMFYASSVTSLDISNFDTSKVTDMASMFRELNIESIDLSNFNTSKVVDMSRMFRDSKMTKLDVSNFDTRNVKTMLQMFNRSAATEIIGLTNFDTTSVENMEYMFNSAVVEELDLSSFDITNTSNIKNMFNGCKSKIGYAKDEETAAKFNDSSVTKIPNTLVFTVKR